MEGEAETGIYSLVDSISSKILITGDPDHRADPGAEPLDEVDADAHETFTLEEMRKLIMTYRRKDKDFLIARVTTPSPEDNDQTYNFYYAAAEINRVLFKFESSRRLLHRMRVKNPLNNMYIVGPVFYYKLPITVVDKAIVDYYFHSDTEKEGLRQACPEIFQASEEQAKGEQGPIEESTGESATEEEETAETSDPYAEVIRAADAGIVKLPGGIPDDRKILYTAEFFATDDDFLVKSEVRDYFRANALEENDDFLYEIDRTRNDFIALLEEEGDSYDEEVTDWRRIFSAHATLAIGMLTICLLLGGGPIFLIIILPLAVAILFSFICSLFYLLFCRRSSFDTLAVNSFEEEI